MVAVKVLEGIKRVIWGRNVQFSKSVLIQSLLSECPIPINGFRCQILVTFLWYAISKGFRKIRTAYETHVLESFLLMTVKWFTIRESKSLSQWIGLTKASPWSTPAALASDAAQLENHVPAPRKGLAISLLLCFDSVSSAENYLFLKLKLVWMVLGRVLWSVSVGMASGEDLFGWPGFSYFWFVSNKCVSVLFNMTVMENDWNKSCEFKLNNVAAVNLFTQWNRGL